MQNVFTGFTGTSREVKSLLLTKEKPLIENNF